MTATEIRPDAAGLAETPRVPEAPGMPVATMAHTAPPAHSLTKRLPYALAALTLAVGFAVGQEAKTAAPRAAAKSSSLVSPEQINRALSASSGAATPVNDRGFSLLENGVQHSHGFELPLNAADHKLLSHQMNIARETALRYPTLKDAYAAGLHRAGPFSPGLGLHMVNYGNYGYGAGKGVMSDAQIEHPLAWIYDGSKPDSPVAGLFYSAVVADPAGFAGPNDVWHQHHNICLVYGKGGIDAPLGADHDVTTAQCAAVHGNLMKATGPLLHVWVVPGYEDSQGVFAHLSPAITCNDGTYRVIDPLKIGSKLTTCVDGSE
jgi:hypothetical protein